MKERVAGVKGVYNRPGSRGHRNAEDNDLRSGHEMSEIDNSGNKIRDVKRTAKAPKRSESRDRLTIEGEKRVRGQGENRDSSREQARGRSEFTGSLNKRVNHSGGMVRTGTTGTKSK
ncbi:MAG: hypothetical protein SFY81_12415 [Verrucomicrobiota bacterium]|nr:hypothetical protein [Verrucomicrobiota bacterium]